jgi:hypothetical protein
MTKKLMMSGEFTRTKHEYKITLVWGWPRQIQLETLREKLKAKRAVGVAQVVDHLPSKPGPEFSTIKYMHVYTV